MILGSCPFCEDGLVRSEKKKIQGRTVKLYSCSNNKVYTEDGELFEPTKDATCSFKIFSNTFARWGKKWLSQAEVRELLSQQEIIVELYSPRAKKPYMKRAFLDEQYGISIDWESDFTPTQIEK